MTGPSGIETRPPPQASAGDIPLLLLDRIDSTMLEAERLAEAGRRGPLVVCAREQTGGAGRHGRLWASPPGNLYWTILLDAAVDRPRDAGLAFAGGLAVVDALRALGVGGELRLKWPNDVLLGGRKVAGVLARTSLTGSRGSTVVGIGVNVATAPSAPAFPAATLPPPAPPLERCRDALTAAFLARRAQWHRDGIAALARDAAALLHGVGNPVRIALDRDRTEVVTGVNEGLDASGAMLLRVADGTRRTVVAGDILA